MENISRGKSQDQNSVKITVSRVIIEYHGSH